MSQRGSHLSGVASGAVVGDVLHVVAALPLNIPGQGGEYKFHVAAGGPEQGGAGVEDFLIKLFYICHAEWSKLLLWKENIYISTMY